MYILVVYTTSKNRQEGNKRAVKKQCANEGLTVDRYENPGHATVAFTLDIYGHVTDKMKKQSSEQMQGYIPSLL